MKKIILAPDSFKGTMSALRICDIMERVIKEHFNDVQILKIPVADGGEGTVGCFLQAKGGTTIDVMVKGPYFENIQAFYAIMPDRETAIIEMATAAGLPLVEDRKNPSLTTTFGVGQLIHHAVQNGCRKIILGMGGSCTNDGGTGMAAALGIKFFDENNEEFVPTGGTLNRLSRLDATGRFKELEKCNILAMCDVNNPLYGSNGAAYIYSPQKGADESMVNMLDNNLQYLSQIIKRDCGMDVANIPGTGAAGGLGAGAIAFIGAELKSGIETVLEVVDFDKLLDETSCIFTGEGKIDGQSLQGKVVVGIARRAMLKKVPVIAVVGDIGEDIANIYKEGVTAVMSINRVALPFSQVRNRGESDLALTMDTLMRLIKSIEKESERNN